MSQRLPSSTQAALAGPAAFANGAANSIYQGPDSAHAPRVTETRTSLAGIAPNRQAAPAVGQWSAPGIPSAPVPRLARISSDCDAKGGIMAKERLMSERYMQEFEQSFAAGLRPVARTKVLSPNGYFKRQTCGLTDPKIPVDPEDLEGGAVVVDHDKLVIYDAYLLRVDIAKNSNEFQRHQIVKNPFSHEYHLFSRKGRVGQLGQVDHGTGQLERLAEDFRKAFRIQTGTSWHNRYREYSRPFAHHGRFKFVELDYHRASAAPQEETRRYPLETDIHPDVRELMELMLTGPAKLSKLDADSRVNGPRSHFTAPYEYLSPWACFLGFKTLMAILTYLDSGKSIRWKDILAASNCYRSQIPFSTTPGEASRKPPVISSYHAIFLELKFLYQLWPRPELGSVMADISFRGSLQQQAYKFPIHPAYHAYNSLPHGFRRLTVASALEFTEIKKYLLGSWQAVHYMNVELVDIYQVFLKKGLRNPYRDWIESKLQLGDTSGEERMLLWHGTPIDSLFGILDLGLRIRREGYAVTGSMLGNGIYLADAASKSATFCRHRASEGEAVLLLCEADVGRHRIKSRSSMAHGHDEVARSHGQFRCIEGVGQHGPAVWKTVVWDMTGEPGNSGSVQMVFQEKLHLEIGGLRQLDMSRCKTRVDLREDADTLEASSIYLCPET
ncbi:hypothetical protein OQA88_13295 [Cercophora sp. LCS_1]